MQMWWLCPVLASCCRWHSAALPPACLHVLCRKTQLVLRMLDVLSGSRLNAVADGKGWLPLHAAVAAKNAEVVKQMMRQVSACLSQTLALARRKLVACSESSRPKLVHLAPCWTSCC